MAYDLRSETGIPTQPVGSLPRPAKLQAAYADYDAGKISKQGSSRPREEPAVKDSISRFEATGSPVVADGEQWWSSFATYPVTDTLAGTGLADGLAPRQGRVLRDLLRRPLPSAATARRRAVPLQGLCRRHARPVDRVCVEPSR